RRGRRRVDRRATHQRAAGRACGPSGPRDDRLAGDRGRARRSVPAGHAMTAPGRQPGDGAGDATATGLYAHSDFAPGTVLAERFRIESILGVGGMGVVYRATDLALGVPVAIKLLRPELMHRQDAFDRFRQELL